MKNLTTYIKEAREVEVKESKDETKTVTFNFAGIDSAEDTLKSLEGMEYVTVEDDKVTVTVTSSNFEKLETVQDILQQTADTESHSSHKTNNEQYAQKVNQLSAKCEELNDAIDSFYDDGDDAKDNSDDSDDKKDDE